MDLFPVEKYLQENRQASIKKIKIFDPSYYMLSSYTKKGNEWFLSTRESFISDDKGLLYEINYILNMPQDLYVSKEEPSHERAKVKVKIKNEE